MKKQGEYSCSENDLCIQQIPLSFINRTLTPGAGGLTTPTSTASKGGKSVKIADEASTSVPSHRTQFIPYSPSTEQQHQEQQQQQRQQQYHAYYQQQLSMSSGSTGDQNFSEVAMSSPAAAPLHAYDSYYPYASGYNVYSVTGQVSTPPPLPPPVSTLIAASSLGSAPAMSSTAAKAHCTRAAAITASASHAISAAASSSSSQEKVHVPISLCLMILVAYVSGGGFLFSIWEEDWGYLEGSYFCFISLSTIGFGDLVPGAAVVAGEGGSQERLIICSLYLLTGLALIAMCFNLMQEEVIHRIRRIGQNLGIIKDPELDADESDDDEDEEDDDIDDDDDENSDNNQLDHMGDDGTIAMSNINVDQVTSGARTPQSQSVRQTYAPSYHETSNMRPPSGVSNRPSGGLVETPAVAGNLSPLSMRGQYAAATGPFVYPSAAYPVTPGSPVPMTPISMTPGVYGGPAMMISPLMYPPTGPPPPAPVAAFTPAQVPSSPIMQKSFPAYNWPAPGPS